MRRVRNAAILALAFLLSVSLVVAGVAILAYALPLSASEALNGPPDSAHELGFWLLLLLSLPLWLLGPWLSALAIIRDNQAPRRRTRRAVWGVAFGLALLAGAAARNILGFGNLFVPM